MKYSYTCLTQIQIRKIKSPPPKKFFLVFRNTRGSWKAQKALEASTCGEQGRKLREGQVVWFM